MSLNCKSFVVVFLNGLMLADIYVAVNQTLSFFL